MRASLLMILLLGLTLDPAAGQSSPILRLRPDGPLAPIHAMEFSADGTRLYAAGDDKFVQVYSIESGKFVRNHALSLRHPIGPGPLGAIQSMSISSDQRYVVVGGVGTFKQQAGFSQKGLLIPSFGWSEQTLDEIGSVTLFDNRVHQVRQIKTHPGYVLATKLITTVDEAAIYLVTIGNDEDSRRCDAAERSPDDPPARSLRIFRMPSGEQLHRWPLPQTSIAPKLSAWIEEDSTDIRGLRIAVSSADGKPGGGVDLFQPGKDTPIRFADPIAVTSDRLGKTDQLCVSARQGVSIVDSVNGKLIKRVDLSSQISQSEFIFSMCGLRTRPDLVAVTTRDLADPNSVHRLNLIDMNTNQLLLPGGIPLGNRQNPVLTSDPTGRFIAATADVTNGIKIADVDQLIKRNFQPSQTLIPDFENIRRATLVSDDDECFLRFSVQHDKKNETYDLINDELHIVEPAIFRSFDTPISFSRVNGKNAFISNVTIDGRVIGRISVDSSTMPIGKLIQSERLGGRPLVALAFIPYVGETQARLSIYDPKTGHELRRLNGHEQFVTGIEFSKDNRRLTSVSADGMICVWGLDDLANLIGRRGAILDTRWCLENDEIVIASVPADGSQIGLKKDDHIVGILDDENQIQKIASPEEFFLALSRSRPDTDARVRVKRGGRQLDVSVKLQQAADERKPLFSFICSRSPDTKLPQWLAWTPSGPYQSSGPDIESAAGWHFNPEKPGDAIKFAPFAEYRDEFSGKSLVTELLAVGRLPNVWPPRADANISVRFVDRLDQPIYMRDGQYRTEEKLKRAQVLVSGTPIQNVTGVVGTIDSGPPIEFKRSSENPSIWECDDGNLSMLAREHDVSVTVHSDRLLDGFQRERFDLVARELPVAHENTLPRIQMISHVGETQISRSDLIKGDFIRVEAMVDADRIEPDDEIIVLRDGRELALQKAEIVENHASVQVPLVVGNNHLLFRIRRGTKFTDSAPFEIEVNDPILIESLTGEVVERNSGRLILLLKSNHSVEKREIRVSVDGVGRNDFLIETPNQNNDAAASTSIRMVVSNLILPEGEHDVEVASVDSRGRVQNHRSVKLISLPQPLQPKIDLSIAENAIVDSADLDVAIQIESLDLKRLTIRVGDKIVPTEVPQADAKGLRIANVSIPLSRGVNRVMVTVVSDAGLMTTIQRQINRIDRPVGVMVERFVMADGEAIEFIRLANGSYKTAKDISEAVGQIEGHVRLPSPDASSDSTTDRVRASVNGFLQSVVPLKRKADHDTITFRIPVTLSSTINDIHLDLPGLVESESSTANLSVGCTQPSLDQTLHLLVISTRVSWRERKNYEKQVLELLGITHERMPAFSHVISGSPVYPALTGEVSRSDNVRPLIDQCRFELSDKQGVNNTVLIYFHGEELRNERGQICLMTVDARPDRAFDDPTMITSTYLAKQFEGLKCANLLFLDVTPHVSSAESPYAGDPDSPGLGVLRLVQDRNKRPTPSPELLGHISRVLPRVGQIGQLAKALEVDIDSGSGLAISESIPQPIRWMRFGELVTP